MANRTKFAGLYRALDYFYGGSVVNVCPPALTIVSAPTATGAGTATVTSGVMILTDGTQAFPLATTASVLVGSGSNQETVTPSAVSSPTSSVPGVASFTATCANLHGQGDPVASATAGLQEAINDASTNGGGTVVVDASWTSAGGTSAMVATAQAALPSTVTIQDNRSGALTNLRVASGTISNALILTLNTVAQAIVLPQGAGTLIDVIDVMLENVNTGTAYVGSPGVIALAYQAAGAANQTTLAAPTIAATFLTGPTAPTCIRSVGVLASAASTAVLNVGVYLSVLTNNPTTGTGTLKYRVTYVVHTGL